MGVIRALLQHIIWTNKKFYRCFPTCACLRASTVLSMTSKAPAASVICRSPSIPTHSSPRHIANSPTCMLSGRN